MIHKISARKFRLKTLKTCNFKFNSAEPCSKIFDPSLSGEFAPWTELDIESAINITWVSSGSDIFEWTFASYCLGHYLLILFLNVCYTTFWSVKIFTRCIPYFEEYWTYKVPVRELCYPQNALFTWKTYSMWRSRVAIFLRILSILRLLAMKKSIAISYIEIYHSFAILNSGIKSDKIICFVISLQPYYTTLWKFYREIRNINIWCWKFQQLKC